MNKQLTAPDIRALKNTRKITMLTAYDYPTGLLVDKAGVEMILVGDSLAMVVLGHDDTLSVTMDEMLHHCRAVCRGAENALVVGDMPYGSYHESEQQAVHNAIRFMREGGARAVKVEGAAYVDRIRAIIQAEVPVQGHVGLTPQSVARFGGFKVQGRTADAARQMIDDARRLEDAGCFSIVLEAVPEAVAARITEELSIPTIGIGAGPACDGQVLVYHDVLGLFDRFTPKFVKRYAELSENIVEALTLYRDEVRSGAFPAEEHGFGMQQHEKDELDKLY